MEYEPKPSKIGRGCVNKIMKLAVKQKNVTVDVILPNTHNDEEI